jgi:Domain of Unknown Function (DUF1599).
MKPQKLSLEAIKNAHSELTDIFERKNKDYGNSFEESLEKHGLIAAVVRMEDKMLRLTNLSKKESEQLVNDESLIDTLKDLSNYALMTAVWLEQTQLFKEVDDKIASYKEVPFVKDNENLDNRGIKFKSIINDIISFDPDLIVSINTITFDNRIHPETMTFDVSNTLKLIRWWNNSIYSQKLNYYIHHYNTVADGEPGRIRITIK